jgi:hypothetical protein
LSCIQNLVTSIELYIQIHADKDQTLDSEIGMKGQTIPGGSFQPLVWYLAYKGFWGGDGMGEVGELGHSHLLSHFVKRALASYGWIGVNHMSWESHYLYHILNPNFSFLVRNPYFWWETNIVSGEWGLKTLWTIGCILPFKETHHNCKKLSHCFDI